MFPVLRIGHIQKTRQLYPFLLPLPMDLCNECHEGGFDRPVISLKRHIDAMDVTFRQGFISAYRTLLHAMGTWGPRAVPDLGDDLSKRLKALENELDESVSEALLQRASQQAEADLSDWAEQANIR